MAAAKAVHKSLSALPVLTALLASVLHELGQILFLAEFLFVPLAFFADTSSVFKLFTSFLAQAFPMVPVLAKTTLNDLFFAVPAIAAAAYFDSVFD